MKVELVSPGAEPPRAETLLAVPIADPPDAGAAILRPVDRALDGLVTRAVDDGEIRGRAGEFTLFRAASTLGSAAGGRRAGDHLPGRVAVVGVGAGAVDDWRKAGSTVAAGARDLRADTARLSVSADVGPVEAGAFIDGFAAGQYRFDRFKGEDGDDPAPPPVALEISGGTALASDLSTAAATAKAVARARDLCNTPANHLTPPDFAEYARERSAAIEGLECEVLGEEELDAMGAGAMASVAHGSQYPPQLIILRYTPSAVAREGEILGVVGKAITFDTGGISIKPSGGMEEMKMDMGGGAAALESALLIAELGLPVPMITAIAAAENMPSGTATKPGDVVTALSGSTIEVINTDAEGRLVMADALTYLAEHGATRLIDFATLTGAIVVALGEVYAGLFGSDEEWTEDVRSAGEVSGDLCWPMPLHERYRPLIESDVADFANAAKKRQAGAVYAGMFLKEFTGGVPWCHVDIAGTAMVNGAGTGFGVRLMLALAQRLALTP